MIPPITAQINRISEPPNINIIIVLRVLEITQTFYAFGLVFKQPLCVKVITDKKGFA